LVSDRGTTVHRGNLVVDGDSFHVVVEVGVSEAPMLRRLGERWSTPPSPLNAERYSSTESSIMACYGVDALLRVEPTKMAPSSLLLGERLRPPK
jgi:hypothetical protein